MWVFTKDGFLSAVQHDEDRVRMRVRARRREHLDNAFPGYDILDMAEEGGPYDYRWHVDISRGEWVDYLAEAAMDVDYTSHVKEAISGDDKELYEAMLKVWTALYAIQSAELEPPVDEPYIEWDDETWTPI